MKAEYNVPKYADLVNKAVNETVQVARVEIMNTAKQNAPVNTGYYRENITLKGTDIIEASANYSAALEYGISNPVVIEPKNAKALHFTTKDGTEVFTKRVQQVATQPKSIMRNAAREVQKKIPQIFWEVVK